MYLYDLQLYVEPPMGEVLLREFQEFSIERLKVLKLVERVWVQNQKKSSKMCKDILITKLQKHDLHEFARLVDGSGCKSNTDEDYRIRRMDHISHFILRSAFAFVYQKKKWFYAQEIRLFKWRCTSLDDEGIQKFLSVNGLNYTPISMKEKYYLEEYLDMCSISMLNIDKVPFYKVPFTEVLSLVKKRKVFLLNGQAYVPMTKIASLFTMHFKKRLSEGFEYAREVAVKVADDVRFTDMFKVLLQNVQTSNFRFGIVEHVSVEEFDELSEISYPLCMRNLHNALRSKHHLTNGGRVQYGLFLKGIGISLADSLEFWKKEFTQKVDEVTFHKQYRYHIRHLYGQEGKRADYDPFSCSKIMRAKIGPKDHHGCPFKCMQIDELEQMLSGYGLYHLDIKSITKLAEEGLYNLACNKYYEITHDCLTENLIHHPNIYFNESRKILNDSE